jgi:hypothetical protein
VAVEHRRPWSSGVEQQLWSTAAIGHRRPSGTGGHRAPAAIGHRRPSGTGGHRAPAAAVHPRCWTRVATRHLRPRSTRDLVRRWQPGGCRRTGVGAPPKARGAPPKGCGVPPNGRGVLATRCGCRRTGAEYQRGLVAMSASLATIYAPAASEDVRMSVTASLPPPGDRAACTASRAVVWWFGTSAAPVWWLAAVAARTVTVSGHACRTAPCPWRPGDDGSRCGSWDGTIPSLLRCPSAPVLAYPATFPPGQEPSP